MTRVASIIKEYKEIIILLTAVGSLYAVSPKNAPPPSIATVQHALDSLNRRMDRMSQQIDALVRMQCAKSDNQTLALAGVACEERRVSLVANQH